MVRGPNSTRKRPGEKALPALRPGNCQPGVAGTPLAPGKEEVCGRES